MSPPLSRDDVQKQTCWPAVQIYNLYYHRTHRKHTRHIHPACHLKLVKASIYATHTAYTISQLANNSLFLGAGVWRRRLTNSTFNFKAIVCSPVAACVNRSSHSYCLMSLTSINSRRLTELRLLFCILKANKSSCYIKYVYTIIIYISVLAFDVSPGEVSSSTLKLLRFSQIYPQER